MRLSDEKILEAINEIDRIVNEYVPEEKRIIASAELTTLIATLNLSL